MIKNRIRAMQRKDDGLQVRDNVLAIVAHDLNTPLNTIMMAADLLEEIDDAEQRGHFLAMIRTAAKQAEILIRDLLDAAKLESGRFRVESTRESLPYLVKSTVEMLTPTAENAGVLLACDVEAVNGVTVMVDQPRFVQLMSNLLSNAIKFTQAGGNVLVTARVSGSSATVCVRDSGVGISDDELPHVFERFWQASHHRRAGAGLGLAIAKGIVEAHGGEIGVQSKQSYGSTFWFTLPLG